MNWHSDVVMTRNGVAVIVQHCKGFVYGSVVAVVVDSNLLSPGYVTGVAQNVTVGVGCGEGELPLWHPKALCQ